MYTLTCDGNPLLDARDDAYILGNPRVKNEVNKVGEGSFKIYFNHPNIGKLIPLRSIFEVKDEYGVIFRGRMTEDTKDFDNCKDVDLEGVMSFFNDSIVRPYVFPDDFEIESGYKKAAAESPKQAAMDGGVVRFFLKWLIDNHNEQVEPFQRFELGKVTVYDTNNYIERASSDYASTWEEISDKLFNSSLGGYLCIRYEDDGNYIDYLREFTEVNEQGITYGENMLDISHNTNASATYSAILPLGADISQSNGDVSEKLTIKGLPDGNITEDIVKVGDTLYSKRAVAAYGWRYAPMDESTWDDVTEESNLQQRGVEFLGGDSVKIPNTINVVAVDLNCTDSQIRTFRIYKKIPVYTPAHGINDNFDLTALDIDLLNPQNTKITVGKTLKVMLTMTEYQNKQQTNSKNISGKVVEGFKETKILIKEVSDTLEADFAKKTELALSIETDDEGNKYSSPSESAGKVVFDTGKIEINSDAFQLDVEGNVTASNLTMKGGTITLTDDDDKWVELGIGGGLRVLDLIEMNGYYACAQYSANVLRFGRSTHFDEAGEDIENTNVFLYNAYGENAFVNVYGNWVGTVSGSISSDATLKHDIELLDSRYDAFFDGIISRRFKYNDGSSGRYHFGYITQEIQKALADAGINEKEFAAICTYNQGTEKEFSSLRYSEFISLNTWQIQMLKAKVKELEERLKTYETHDN